MLPNTTTPVEQSQVPDSLMREIAYLYLDLEPENIWMDGEATPAQARARSVAVNRKLKDAWVRAGRVVTDGEALAWYADHRDESKKKPTGILGQLQGLQEDLAQLREVRIQQDPPPSFPEPLRNSGEDYYEIAPEDVGKPYLRLWGRMWPVQDFLGRVFKQDVGKRVYLRGGVLQVENPEQMAARLAHSEDEDSKETIALGSRVKVKTGEHKGKLGFVSRLVSGEEGARSYFVDLDRPPTKGRSAVIIPHDQLQVVKRSRQESWGRGTKVRVNKDIPDYGGETGEIVTTKRSSVGWRPGDEANPVLLIRLDRQQDRRVMPFRPDEVAILEMQSTSHQEVDFRGFKEGDRVMIKPHRDSDQFYAGMKATITNLQTSQLNEPLCAVKLDSTTDPEGYEIGGGETVFYPWELVKIQNEDVVVSRTPAALPDHTLVTDSQDVRAVCDSVGVNMDANGITGALVVVGEGEYEDVWLTDNSRPFDNNANYHPPAYFNLG